MGQEWFSLIDISDLNRSVGSIRRRLNGLPKNPNDGVLLRPILFMFGSSKLKMAKRLVTILQLVLDLNRFKCIKKSLIYYHDSHSNHLSKPYGSSRGPSTSVRKISYRAQTDTIITKMQKHIIYSDLQR